MIKKIIITAFAIMLIGALGFALRLWLVKKSVEHINAVITDTTAKTLSQIRTTTGHISLPNMPTITNKPSSDQEPPKANLQDWDSISNRQQICWIHKKTHKKVCEQKT